MGSGCGGERSEWDDKAVKDSMAGKNTGLDPKIREEVRPQVEAAIEARTEEMAKERIEKHIEKDLEREPEEKLTQEKAEKIIKDEFHSWPKEVRERVFQYYFKDSNRGILAGFSKELITSPKWWGIIYKPEDVEKPVIETEETVTHEFCHVIWDDLMIEEEQKRWEECYNKAKVNNNFVTPYAKTNPEEFFCENMAKFKWEPELLKKRNPEAFKLAQEKYISNEVERVQEQFKEGGVSF